MVDLMMGVVACLERYLGHGWWLGTLLRLFLENMD